MLYLFLGKLCGYLCDECLEALSDATVRLYRLREGQDVANLVAASPKHTFDALTDEMVKAKEPWLLAEAQTDAEGRFTVRWGENQRYGGEAFEVDIVLTHMPGQQVDARRLRSRQFTITALQPEWREAENGLTASWEYCLPARIWCGIRAIFRAWVICGRVVVCQQPDQPIGGVKVSAFDADWITDDPLGSAVTDAAGKFRIYYTSADFHKTFLSPIINVEVPFPPFDSGPDVYFRIEATDGTVLLAEGRADGHKPGRNNVGHCMCVQLCVNLPVPPQEQEHVPTVWTKVGTAFTIPAGGILNGFTVDGYAGAAQYALTGKVRLVGDAPRKQNGHPIEYRFLVSHTTDDNTKPPLGAGSFTKIVGVAPNETLFAPTEVGQLIRYAPFTILNVVALRADLDAEGWLDVNTSIERTFDAAAIPVADRPGFFWVDSDALLAIDTIPLTTAPDVPTGAAGAGQPVPADNRIPVERIALRFEAREVINKATSSFVTLPGSGSTLNSMVINNNATFMKVAMTEHLTGTPCGVLHGAIHIAYTVHHPHISDVNLIVRSNDYSINTGLTDAVTSVPIAGNTNPSVNHVNNGALSVNPPLTLHKCTYLVTLAALRRLHSGDSADISGDVQTTFYWEP